MQVRATLTASIWKEGSDYVAMGPELGVSSCGATPDEAAAMLKEAVELYLENARALGIFQRVEAAVNAPFRFTAPLEGVLS